MSTSRKLAAKFAKIVDHAECLPMPAIRYSEHEMLNLTHAIDRLVSKQGITPETPGVAIAISQPGRLQFQKGYGLADLRTRVDISHQTLFELASVSKPLTATALLILWERGQISLEDDIRNFLPELPDYGEPICLRDLLTHLSGLPCYQDFKEVRGRHAGYCDNYDYLGEFARQQVQFPIRSEPGRCYEYNNSNYLLLALIIERISNKSFGIFLRDEVLVPAEMHHSFVYESPQSVPLFPKQYTSAISYKRRAKNSWLELWGTPPAFHQTVLVTGDGSVWSNLEDMVRFDSAIRKCKLLKSSTIERALLPSQTTDGHANNYGFGWTIYPSGDGTLNGFGHDGSWRGFKTSYYRYLVEDRTTILLSNRENFDPNRFWYDLDHVIESHIGRYE